MNSFEPSRDHDQGEARAPERLDVRATLPRRIARKGSEAATSPASIIDHAATAWSFRDAVNAGIHPIARSGDGGDIGAGASAAVSRAAGSSGDALPAVLQRKFESSLGVDLSGVRVHTGDESARAAGAVAARAYALGQDVHFGADQYDPSSPAGEHLLAHEVAHTVQQRGGSSGARFKLEVTGAGDACEVEADAAADAMVSGRAFQVGGVGTTVARDPALTPGQDQALRVVQHQSAAQLGARDQSELVRLANLLDAARGTQTGPQRATIARALVRLYDGMEANLRRRFDAGEDTGIAAEITPFSMIDVWVVDAGESRRAHRRRPAQRSDGHGDRGTTGGGGGGGTLDTGAAIHAATAGMTIPAPHVGETGHTLHAIGLGAEIAHTAIDVAMLIPAIEHGLGALAFGVELFGLALAGVGTVATAAAVLTTGDEFNRVGGELQPQIVHFCGAFSHVLRGEAAGSGGGSSMGARAARATLDRLAAQGITPQQIVSSQGFLALYLVAWQRITPGLASRLAHAGEGAVPNAAGFAHGFIEATLPGHSAYQRYIN